MKKTHYLLILLIIIGLSLLIYRQIKRNTQLKTQRTITPTQTAQKKEIVPLNTSEGITIDIISPVDKSTVNTPSVLIKGKTAASADVFINEKELKADAQGNFSATVTLEEGENYLIVAANDSKGNYAEKEIIVNYQLAQ